MIAISCIFPSESVDKRVLIRYTEINSNIILLERIWIERNTALGRAVFLLLL